MYRKESEARDSVDGKAKILIVDDHPIMREGLSTLINLEPDLVVCGEAGDGDSALAALAESKPDLVILDLSLPGITGFELIRQMKKLKPRLPILVVSMHDETFSAERALRAGALGYLMKSEATVQVITAIRCVLKGDAYVSESMTSHMIARLVAGGRAAEVSPVERFSDREFEVFRLVGRGHSTSRIAKELHLSVKTVESHRANIKRKLGVKDATELLQYAVGWTASDGIR